MRAKKKSKTQERFEAIYKVKGKKNLADIWDTELEPTTVKKLQDEANQG